MNVMEYVYDGRKMVPPRLEIEKAGKGQRKIASHARSTFTPARTVSASVR